MNESLEHVISKLSKRQDYIESFRLAFKDTVINTQRMLRALAQFTGSMISCNSKYDKYMAGKDTLSTTELHGLKVFRNRCSNCHKEPLFTDNGFHNIGLMPDTVLKDFGRVNVTGIDSDYMKFKTPSLRNVELTYPYMHDGRFRNLNQVLNHYSTGNFFTENFDKLIMQTVKLSEIEKADLIAFMKTLTDKEFLYDRRFADPNHR
jgi:cytochrome c peroxidase